VQSEVQPPLDRIASTAKNARCGLFLHTS